MLMKELYHLSINTTMNCDKYSVYSHLCLFFDFDTAVMINLFPNFIRLFVKNRNVLLTSMLMI